ncbi:MAG: MTAP family purine nucleoside phosphorylase [Armatimonadota bacterium]
MHIAIIAGTGIDELPEFATGKHLETETRFGKADLIETRFAGQDIVFVPRHGIGHLIPPSLINYRAQIAALKKYEITRIISVCAVGSLVQELESGSVAILSDFIDMTKQRPVTFFDEENGPVVHTDFSEPYCPELRTVLGNACKKLNVQFLQEAVYVGVEGPRYETPAETRLFASWGGHVVGMTNVPEVVLAREAGLCFAGLAIVANLACGLSSNRLSHYEVRKTIIDASKVVISILEEAVKNVPAEANCSCRLNASLIV